MKSVLPVLCLLLLLGDIACGGDGAEAVGSPYGALSIVPPLVAIILAIATRQVFVALFVGIWLGALFLEGGNPAAGFARVLDTYFIHALADPDHVAVVLFSMCLGGMVRVIATTGGLEALVGKISRWARSVTLGQVSTWLMGLAIFFDDYANTLLVGHTMRPFTDRLRISREKLAYIVDSTAAPVATIMPISTWIGYEVGLLGDALEKVDPGANAYSVFLESIPYRFYGLLAILFVLLVALTNRDFLSMHKAERRARETGAVLRESAEPLTDREVIDADRIRTARPHWADAVLPILAVLIVTVTGLYISGWRKLEAGEAGSAGRGLREIIAAANSFHVLMWASFTGAAVAIALALRSLSLRRAMDAYLAGVKGMVLAMAVLVLAWAIGGVCEDLGTADFCVSLASDRLSPHLVPLVVFAIAAVVSFATGTSWATMALLIPIVVGLAWKLTGRAGIEAGAARAILLASIGGVLSGSTFGDHCSPISDTTIMSSMASACDHIDHVKTQMPYALVVAGVGMAAGYLPVGFGLAPGVGIALGLLLLAGILLVFGRPPSARRPDGP